MRTKSRCEITQKCLEILLFCTIHLHVFVSDLNKGGEHLIAAQKYFVRATFEEL